MADWLGAVIGVLSPSTALQRARARSALQVLMHYEAATTSRRATWRPTRGDADSASARRLRLAFVARDLARNNPWARRALGSIAGNVVGDGIIPKAVGGPARWREDMLRLIERHLDTTAIDANGTTNLYGLQRLACATVAESGEVLVRRRFRRMSDGLPMPLQLQLLEPDHLDAARDGALPNGGWIEQGIEYSPIGRRVAYHLFPDHPGAGTWRLRRLESTRVQASEVLHIYRQDRPGQQRGVSWLAPVALALQDLADHQEAHLMRQKIAACFAAFRVSLDADPVAVGADANVAGLSSITPGRIQNLAPGEDIKFASPPPVGDYDPFVQACLRSVAAGMGITYEALTGDLRQVNFSSGRMGRLEMDRNVKAWQWLMMVPQFCEPVGRWVLESAAMATAGGRLPPDARIEWTPPHRELVDPTREIPALAKKVRAGFASRQAVIRELGFDPERVTQEIVEDAAVADANGLVFDTDPRRASGAGVAQAPADMDLAPETD